MATERSDAPAPGNWRKTNPITPNQNEKRNGNRDSDDRLRDLPEWLEEFTDDVEDTGLLDVHLVCTSSFCLSC